LKKEYFGSRKNRLFVATRKNDFSEAGKITISWELEKAIFSEPKNHFFVATSKSDFSETEIIPFLAT